MTEIQAKHEETKPASHNEQEKPIKSAATKQIKQRPRYFPLAPGLFPVPVDIVITMSLQLALVITNFFVIFTTFTYDGDDLGWIVLAEIIFTYAGFAYFVRKISHQILVYKKFFLKLNDWHDRKLEAIKNGNSSCPCTWYILLKLAWWITALLLFPIIIGWSMIQSYGWYQDRRRNAESTVDLTQLENVAGNELDAKQYWKMTDRAYSIWHLGVLSKQASMIVMFVQDFPLLIISFIIVNYLGIIVYCVSVCIKLLFWFKHMYDLGKLTFFYKPEHYLAHFGIKSISWSHEYGCNIIVADFFNEYEYEMLTLQVGDWVRVYDEKREHGDVMIVWKNKDLEKEDNLVLIEWKKVPKEAIDEFDKGIAKKINVAPDAVHVANRWDFNIELLRDEDYVNYHDNGGDDAEEAGDNVEDHNVEEEQQHVGAVVVARSTEMQVENDAIDEKSEDVVIDVDIKENNDEEHGNNVNDTEVVGDLNKETEVINDAEDEENGNNMNDTELVNDVDNEDEQDRLIESPVIIQNKDETGGEYQSVPLKDNKDKDTDDV